MAELDWEASLWLKSAGTKTESRRLPSQERTDLLPWENWP